MYQIKRKSGSIPKWLKVTFKNYEEARSALRRYMRKVMKATKASVKENIIRQIATARSMGLSIHYIKA
jgi:hypothetical protein